MANYTNLTSLRGLRVDDVITYDTTTAIDFKGCKVKVELYGKKPAKKRDYSGNGGKTKFVFDTSKLSNKIYSFNSRGDLIYGDTDSLYYRIAVAGDGGEASHHYEGGSSSTTYGTFGDGGAGGGYIGAPGIHRKGSTLLEDGDEATGGTQTSGGIEALTGNSSNHVGSPGGFGVAGAASTTTGTHGYKGSGGYGWYGGGAGYTWAGGNISASREDAYGGGGGSGFLIGVSTRTYPDGYLSNSAILKQEITSAISEGVLTQGASEETNPKMVLTILEVGEDAEYTSEISYYNGTEFVSTNPYYYNGSKFVLCDAYYYNGTEFKKI